MYKLFVIRKYLLDDQFLLNTNLPAAQASADPAELIALHFLLPT